MMEDDEKVNYDHTKCFCLFVVTAQLNSSWSEDQTGRQPNWKMTKMKDDHHTIKERR